MDTSNMSKIADKVFKMLDAIVDRVREENVVGDTHRRQGNEEGKEWLQIHQFLLFNR
ncbi:hypothetical protein NC653_010390 [Populus alba x Populus x berolinensis]|uniref:Uncharacterized protein n=1 Tax=Populus alba x Populus x berolinensis TaxID=444605 RepID=A0AAD6QZN0_9ROSI|nr:hypothetical protein NC653_010390 [Populus alba x Populus x berolinensis]